MISRTPSLGWRSTLEAKGSKMKAFDEHIDDAHGVVLVDVIVEPLRKQGYLTTVLLIDELFHPMPPWCLD